MSDDEGTKIVGDDCRFRWQSLPVNLDAEADDSHTCVLHGDHGEHVCSCGARERGLMVGEQRYVPFARQGAELPGGRWLEAIEHLAAAQRLMAEMTMPHPDHRLHNLASLYGFSLEAMAEAIRQHYITTLRMAERTPVRIHVRTDANGDQYIEVEKDER